MKMGNRRLTPPLPLTFFSFLKRWDTTTIKFLKKISIFEVLDTNFRFIENGNFSKR
jgi:hypothetical protein